MTIKTAAGSQPAAGSRHARISKTIQSVEKNLNSQTIAPGSTANADFTLLGNNAINMADELKMDIIGFPGGLFSAYKDGDFLSPECNAVELERWLYGYFNGKEDNEITNQLNRARLVLDELVKAEQIIQTMTAQMTDTQKQAAIESLIACGFPISDALRCLERGAIIVAARDASGSAA